VTKGCHENVNKRVLELHARYEAMAKELRGCE
jgi:hypothetical protein